MKLTVTCLTMLGVLASAGVAAQVRTVPESTERALSPYDRNPACRERDVSSTDPACVIQDGPAVVRPFAFDNARVQPGVPAAPQPQASPSPAPPVIVVVPPQGGTAPNGR